MDVQTQYKIKMLYNAYWQIPVPYGSKLHIPPTNYHLLAAQQEPYKKKAASLQKMLGGFSGEKDRRMTIRPLAGERKKGLDRKSKRTGQNSQRGNTKGDSSDSQQIETSDIPGLPSGNRHTDN